MDITLEDVESAVRILSEFMKKQKEAQRILRQMGGGRGSSNPFNFNMEDMMQTAIEMRERKKGTATSGVEEEEVAVSDEDLKRMREITDKRKREAEEKSHKPSA